VGAERIDTDVPTPAGPQPGIEREPVTDAEKVKAFDDLAQALTNRWSDGKWCWWNPTPACGTGTKQDTQEAAIAELVRWAKRKAVQMMRKRRQRIPLPKVSG
jgi:hypothetical protein